MKKETRLVLVVEDEKALSEILLEKISEINDVKVMMASDGIEGLKMITEYKPDLILLDIVLPKMDGMSVLKRLREDKWGRGAKVIIMTNLSMPDKEKEARELGVEDFLYKADMTLVAMAEKIKESLE